MSELALQLIEKEKLERTGKLDLGNCGLTNFPKELFELTWLEELSFCNRYFDTKQIKWINSQNTGSVNFLKVYKIPTDFKIFSQLKELQIGGGWKEKWQLKDCTILESLTSLHSLNLFGNQISDISFLIKLPSLRWLDLSSNEIKDYTILGMLTSLKSLSLNSNAISDIRFLSKLTSLQFLDISANEIKAISLLSKLTAIQTLDLSFNEIRNANLLSKLTALQSLDLCGNRITNIDFSTKLTTLQSLDLSVNKIRDINFIEKLSSLQSLDLSGNQIDNISSLKTLNSLVSLNLSRNEISDISYLENMTSLRSLDLCYNEISDISFLAKLTSLESLDLSENQISNISDLKKLTSLWSLDLSGNPINNYGFLEKLTSLQFLNLSSNKIKDYSFLKKLTTLQTLYLSSNKINDYSFLEKLATLQSLDLSYNDTSDFSFLAKLTTLRSLNLSNNQINDYSFLANMTSLASLNLSANKIIDYSVLSSLTSIQTIDLSQNKISDISFLKSMTSLTNLNLRYNQINNIHALIPILKKGISVNLNEFEREGISLWGNHITNPPMNIVEQGAENILNFFEQLEKHGTENLYEARIVIVGESGAGKTTLFKKLKNVKVKVPDQKQTSTHGININQERIFQHKNGVSIKTSIWDFGGQDTQNYLHQYFYAKDNLFVLVCDHRAEKYRFDYWFEVITRLCQESRIVVVRNQNERVTASQSLNLNEYEERFPGLKLSSVDVDLKVNDARWKLLIQTIEENLSAMDRVNQEVPGTWKPIREKIQLLKNEKRCHIEMGEFQAICMECGLPEENYQEQCLDYLHWLGYALHYDDDSLANTIFIDPQWITKGLYEILREENYKPESKGRFSKTDIHTIWKGKYSSTDRTHLLNLLLKDRFEVCYKVENSDNYLVPVLISNEKKEPVKPVKEAYTLRFKFPFMPFGFFSRLVVRLYDKIWNDYVWLTGVWLKAEINCFALLDHFKDIQIGDEVFEVTIYGSKKERKELLAEIRTEIFHIRKLLFPNLIIQEQIPCPCEICVKLSVPYFHNRNEIDNLILRNKFTSECKKSGEDVPINILLDSVIDKDEIEKQYSHKMKDKINVDFKPVIKVSPIQKQKTKVKAMADATATSTVTINIQTILGEVQNLKEDFNRELKIKRVPQEEIDLLTSDIEVAENALKELEAAQKQNEELPAKSKGRLKQFIDDLSNEESTLYKGLKLLRKGKDYGVTLAETYNKIAPNIGLPSVPTMALDIIKKL